MGNELFNKDELIDKFGWEEYFIFALMLAVSAGIGVFFWWRGQKNNGGTKFKALVNDALSLVILVAVCSAITSFMQSMRRSLQACTTQLQKFGDKTS